MKTFFRLHFLLSNLFTVCVSIRFKEKRTCCWLCKQIYKSKMTSRSNIFLSVREILPSLEVWWKRFWFCLGHHLSLPCLLFADQTHNFIFTEEPNMVYLIYILYTFYHDAPWFCLDFDNLCSWLSQSNCANPNLYLLVSTYLLFMIWFRRVQPDTRASRSFSAVEA